MILFDYQQVAISNLMEQIGSSKEPVDENLLRHMILNTIRTYVKKFKESHGPEIIIACDNYNYWRKSYFPYYKASRKKSRDASGHDWTSIFESLNKIKDELKQNSPYKVLDIESVEADDIIGTLTIKFSPHQKILILSTDKDFAQLQKFANVQQYSPIMKKYIVEKNPTAQLKELIIRGDRGDGVPNILSDDDVFVSGRRQKPIMEVELNVWLKQSPEEFCDEKMLRNYIRNQNLIDLSTIPQNIQEKILNTYENSSGKSKQEFMNYLISKRLKNLIEVAHEF